MKKISKLLYALTMLPLLFSSCEKEKIYAPGEPDVENCPSVYFETLSAKDANFVVVPDDVDKPLTFQVFRENTKGDLAVPITIQVTDGKTEVSDIISVSEIQFLDGQEATTVSINISALQSAITYKIRLLIDNPEYYSIYSQKFNNELNISVAIESWTEIGKGVYVDDLFAQIFVALGAEVPAFPIEVTVLEKDGFPGVYKIVNAYDGAAISAYLSLLDPGFTPEFCAQIAYPSEFIIDASNPEKVVWNAAMTGVHFKYFLNGFGDVSFVPDPKGEIFGVLKDGKILFTDGAVLTYDNGAPLELHPDLPLPKVTIMVALPAKE